MTEPKDRLTFDGNFCDIAQCREERWGKYCPDGACSQRKVWERLKQYEDSDAVHVVRCIECKHYELNAMGEKSCFNDIWNQEFAVPTAQDDFCSYGERKEGVD